MSKLVLAFFSSIIIPLIGFASDIAVVTLVVGDKYKDATLPGLISKKIYCNQHGYDFHVCETQIDSSRPIPWSKIVLTKDMLKKYKWVFFSDADSIIMNYAVKLESFIDNDYDLIICRDMHYINTGQYLIRNSSWSDNLLDAIYNQTDVIHDSLWEQRGLERLLIKEPELKNKIKVMPQRTFNSFWKEWYDIYKFSFIEDSTYLDGDFIIHLAGCRDLNNLKTKMYEYALLSSELPCNEPYKIKIFEAKNLSISN